jgi:peptide/nickel transport system ATP-binding protein
MYGGRIVESAPANALFDDPRHPYAQGLLAALPEMAGERKRLTAIPGQVPDAAAMPPGCAFAPRCPIVEDACHAATPELREVGAGRRAACLRARTDPAPAVPAGKLLEAVS